MGLKHVIEEAAETYIKTNMDKHTEFVLEALNKFIPGNWDDAAVVAKKPEILAYVKTKALELASKIDPNDDQAV